ncbi:hypothetical protein [Paenibacillus sp. MER 180]|nr:hypothetical protein [Paenibacillus sp. MER 180]
MYRGGKKIGNVLYIKCGGTWISLQAAAEHEQEFKRFGPYTV